MATVEQVQQQLQNRRVQFYSWKDDKDKVWWYASTESPDEAEIIDSTRQPTPEGALSALIRELTK